MKYDSGEHERGVAAAYLCGVFVFSVIRASLRRDLIPGLGKFWVLLQRAKIWFDPGICQKGGVFSKFRLGDIVKRGGEFGTSCSYRRQMNPGEF